MLVILGMWGVFWEKFQALSETSPRGSPCAAGGRVPWILDMELQGLLSTMFSFWSCFGPFFSILLFLSLMKMFTLFPSQEFPLISGCFLFHLKNQSFGDIAACTQMIIFLIVWLAEKNQCRTKNLTTSSNNDNHDANTSHQVYFLPCSNASTSKKVQGLPRTLQHSGAQASAFSVLPPLVSEWLSYSRLPLPQLVQHWSFSHYVFNLVRKRG